MHAVARYDWGRWVADCPNPRCTNALELEPGQTRWACVFPLDRRGDTLGGCRTEASITWPDNPVEIERSLLHLPESQQQWRPTPEEQP